MSWRKYHSEKNVNKTLSQPPSSDGLNKTGKKWLDELLLGQDDLIPILYHKCVVSPYYTCTKLDFDISFPLEINLEKITGD